MLNALKRYWHKLLASQPIAPSLGEKPLRREEYDKKYAMSLAQWLIHHQKDIVYTKASWMGTTVWKNPFDIWIYQEIIHEVKPDVIVEIGSQYGGSTKYLAHLLDIVGTGIVISIDIDRSGYDLVHGRVIALTGNSADPEIIAEVERLCRDKTVLIIHDGDHRKVQVLKDLNNYSPLVSVNSYFIVEDGIVDLFHYGDGLGFEEPGPLAAVEEFLRNNQQFVVDAERERYILTYNPRGYLKRIS